MRINDLTVRRVCCSATPWTGCPERILADRSEDENEDEDEEDDETVAQDGRCYSLSAYG